MSTPVTVLQTIPAQTAKLTFRTTLMDGLMRGNSIKMIRSTLQLVRNATVRIFGEARDLPATHATARNGDGMD